MITKGTSYMLLAREFVAYLSRRLVERLTPQQIETPEPQAAVELFNEIITEELSAEDQLNDEVRDILEQYADYMRREGSAIRRCSGASKTRWCSSERCASVGPRHGRRDEAVARQGH